MTDSEIEKNEFVPIPLPSQVPEPPDLSKVPLSIIHSATVETLLSQTEDLMARLKVQIRRNAVLERRALDFEDKSTKLEKQLLSLQQQNEIFVEKDSSQTERIKELQNQLESCTKELSLLELRYNEIFTLSQKQETEFNKTITDLNAKILDLEKLLPLETENIKVRDENNFFKGKIEELCNYIQRKEDELLSFKNQISAKNELISQSEEQIKKLKVQVEFNTRAIAEKAELENLIILKDREKIHATEQLQRDLGTQKQDFQNLHTTYKTLQYEHHTLQAQLRTLEETTTSLQKDNADLEKQVENMQNLWYKMQSEFEKEKSKNNSLNKLNRELALQLHHKISTNGNEDDYFNKFLLQNKEIEV